MFLQNKKNLRSKLGLLLAITLLLTGGSIGQALAANISLIPEDAPEISLPTNGIAPMTEIQLTENQVKDIDVLATATVKPYQTYAYVTPQVPGGTRYGYDWISNSTNTGTDSPVLAAIYEALVTYADTAYHSTGTYTNGGSYYYAGTLAFNTNTIKLPVDYSNGTINLSGPTSTKSLNLLRLAWAVFGRDNPQYYMFENGFAYSYSISGTTAYISMMLPVASAIYSTYPERQSADAKIAAKYAEYVTQAATVSTQFEKARIVHDKILAERDYSYVNNVPDNSPTAHNILGVMDISTHGPVCEAYAEAYAYILNRLGINTLTIFGLGNGGGHSWNLIQLNGTYYYADPTWDDFETVGYPAGSYDDEGNLKNQLYYLYFMVGSSNTKFTTAHKPGTTTGGNAYYMYGMPTNINATDFNTMTGSAYKWLGDNGRNNQSYTYGPQYNYYIGYTNSLGYPTADPNGLFVNRNGGYYWNGNSMHNFGNYTISSTATTVPVVGHLYKWNFDYTSPYFNVQFTNPVALVQGTDFDIVVEKPYKQGLNRAYVYGKGAYRGIDLGVVNLTIQ